MVPLYTFFVKDTGDFGYYDLCLTVIFLVMPLVTLQLRDGAFRFLLETQDHGDRSKIITFIYRTLTATVVISFIATILLATFTNIGFLWYCLLLLIATLSAYQEIQDEQHALGHEEIRYHGKYDDHSCGDEPAVHNVEDCTDDEERDGHYRE